MADYFDGHPGAAGLDETSLLGRAPEFSLVGLREMVVVGRKFADEEGNRSRSFVEYTVRDMNTTEQIDHVRRMSSVMGIDNGDEAILHQATRLLSGVGKIKRWTPGRETDGDRVLVGFIEGVRSRAVILGALARSDAGYGAKKADGERRYVTHAGTSWQIKSNGEYEVRHKSGSSVTLNDSGDVTVSVPSGKHIILNDGTGGEALVKKSEFDDHKHGPGLYNAPAGGGAVTGTSGGAAAVIGTTVVLGV